MTTTDTEASAHVMQCMEVWGGNEAVNRGVTMPGLDCWVYACPHGSSAGGGDVHYVSSCATGRVTRLLVADVSGHGEEASSVALELRAMMRRYVNYLDQTRFVRALNREFARGAEVGRFATALVATYFAPTDALYASNAGHPPPLFYRAAEGRWSLLESRRVAGAGPANLPLGVMEPTLYDQFSVKLRPGDAVVIYTDSLIEARDRSGKQLGKGGLLAAAEGLDPGDPARMVEALVARVLGEGGPAGAEDDVTVLALKPNGVKARASIAAAAAATGRIIKSLARSAIGRGPVGWPELRVENIGGAAVGSLNQRWQGGDGAEAGR